MSEEKHQVDHRDAHSSKREQAAALKYDGTNTPKLIAKGEGEIAREIISIAEQNDVHIHYDPLLLDVLSRLEMGDEIPENLFLAVAKIIAFAYYLQGKHPQKQASKDADSELSLSDESKRVQTLRKDED